MTRARIEFGGEGERVAEDYLTDKGYRVIERSYRCKIGQIDLVMRDGDTIVFVEVKNRSSSVFGRPEEAVDGRKQRKLMRLAEAFLLYRRITDVPVRFDVVAILDGKIEHIPDAFRA